jgi:DNA-binding CsgD family transcriptional regulator
LKSTSKAKLECQKLNPIRAPNVIGGSMKPVVGNVRLEGLEMDPRAPYRGSEIEAVAPIAGFLIKALHRHRELIGPAAGHASITAGEPKHCRREMAAHLRDVLLAESFGLSPREAEVCAGIILGYTTLGISLNFEISVNTVATHRKRAYRKLGISSQNELFSRYFHIVNQLARAAACGSDAGVGSGREPLLATMEMPQGLHGKRS